MQGPGFWLWGIILEPWWKLKDKIRGHEEPYDTFSRDVGEGWGTVDTGEDWMLKEEDEDSS